MNKTVSINIGGYIFHIEEEAYSKLGQYLDTIKGYFLDTEGRDEIMGDIEARIAEMFNERVGNQKQVITMKDVDEVIEVMGQPEAFIDSDEDETPKEKYQSSGSKRTKRVFRDPDNQTVAGVCGGLGAYFNIDPIWFRLAFVLAVIFGGSGLLLYIILWLVIPEARTTAEKLEMRGENVNIENIEKTIREEIDSLKQKFNDMSDGAKSWAEGRDTYHAKSFLRKCIDLFIQLVRGGIKIFAKAFGAMLVFIGIFIMVLFIGSFLGLTSPDSFNTGGGSIFFSAMNPPFLDFFGTPAQVTWGIIALLLMIGIPLVAMIYAGVKLLFNINYKNRFIAPVLGGLWSVGIILWIMVCINIGRDFASTASVKESHTITFPESANVLYLETNKIKNEDYHDMDDEFFHHWDDNIRFDVEGNLFYDNPKFDIVKSETDSFVLDIVTKSNGATKKQAYKRAENVSYSFTHADSVLQFDRYFKIFKEDKWRYQTVKIRLRMPVGSTIFLSNSMRYIIHDIDNVSNTWDGDMINRRWKMTERGLECVDCENLKNIKQPIPPITPPAPPSPTETPEVIGFDDEPSEHEWFELPENDITDIHKYDKSKEQFDYEMKKKLNEILFEMRNNPKPSCS